MEVMPVSPRRHGKLNNPKHASVSIDSLLGVLSSAYGTEQLDSSIIFEKDTVNWSNISVENLKAIPKKKDSSDKKKKKSTEHFKVNAATSTSSLRAKNEDEDEVDATLVPIKSLVNLQKITSTFDINQPSASQNLKAESGEAVPESVTNELDTPGNQMEDQNGAGEPSVETDYSCKSPVCGFYVDDINNKVIFDIQFVKKTTQQDEIMPTIEIGEPEIIISIRDTSKPMKANVKVAKSSLVSKVKYFADVEKDFGLENLNVVVRCNFGIFNWVLQWIMSDVPMCRPLLNVTNLKAILSMSNHLGIYQLVEECLDFFRQNIVSVLNSDREIEDVFDDKLLLNLTKRFSNTEVELMSKDFESFKTKIYCSMIKLLADPQPCQSMGHYSSLSTMFQCGFCKKIMHVNLIDKIPCRTDCTQLAFDGKLEYRHECSTFWNLSMYIEAMYEELKDWRLVYWQLWGLSHFSYCEVCRTWYPMVQSDWCLYHPGEVEYFPMKNNLLYPIGTYGCCGEKTFKFSTVSPLSGCKYKNHVSKLDTMEKVQIFNVYHEFKHIISIHPPTDDSKGRKFVKLVKTDDFSRPTLQNELRSKTFWWNGLLLAPDEKKDYSLIPLKVLNVLRNRPEEKKEPKTHAPLKYRNHVHFGVIVPLSEKSLENPAIDEPTTSHQTQVNKKSRPKFNVKKGKQSNICLGFRNRTKKKKSLSYMYQPVESVWTDMETNKGNQDNQRDFEEIAMRKLVQILTPDSLGPNQSSAGSYIRLETEWWQRNCGSHMDKTSSTVVNRTFPLSWFRRLTI